MQHAKTEPMFRFLALLTIASTAGLQAWRTLFNNFAVEIVHLQGQHIGMIQSVREIPGFLALLAIFIISLIKEHHLSSLSIVILGVGVALTGVYPTYTGVILTTLLMSFGFHYYETTNQSLTLQYFDKETSPWVFGKLRSYAAASSIGVGGLIWAFSFYLSYKLMFAISGGAIILIGIWGLMQNPTREDLPSQRKKMVLRKKYWLYYFLTFMAGARRQIFVAFAVFLLVKKFAFTVQEITALFIVNNIVNYFLSPMIGKAIIRFGERKVLSLEYTSLLFIFTAYAFVESKIFVAILYILDHIFFNFAIGIRTYFQKIGNPKDIAPTMAVGFTINHIAAVVIPAAGGLLWIVDYRIPFLLGAGLSFISLIGVQFIKSKPAFANRSLV
ncbi:MAG: MFS transporter [Deferribacteres bacterium]|nr:MFS transporter [candidate division KSB1 bacterium]MCB9502483.1 MFS transporter [Deferribacteres bacterium]